MDEEPRERRVVEESGEEAADAPPHTGLRQVDDADVDLVTDARRLARQRDDVVERLDVLGVDHQLDGDIQQHLGVDAEVTRQRGREPADAQVVVDDDDRRREEGAIASNCSSRPRRSPSPAEGVADMEAIIQHLHVALRAHVRG